MSEQISDEELGRLLRRAWARPVGDLPPFTMTPAEMRAEAERRVRERRWSHRLRGWLRRLIGVHRDQ